MLYANSRSADDNRIGAAGAAGHGHRRQGRHRQTRCGSGESARNPIRQLRQADRGGAAAPLPVADPAGAAARRAHRRVRPLALRGRADRPGARPRAARGVGQALRRDQRVREEARRRAARRSSRSRCSSRSTSRRSGCRKRLRRPDKYWKYNPADIDERLLWPKYQEAYQAMLERTSTDYAPWHVVPCDRKWYSRLAITELLIEALEGLDLSWPPAGFRRRGGEEAAGRTA